MEAVGRMGVKHEGAFRMANPVGRGIKRHTLESKIGDNPSNQCESVRLSQ